MKSYFKSLFLCLIFAFYLLSCNKEARIQSKSEGVETTGDRPKEEEIKYFHMAGSYIASFHPLDRRSDITDFFGYYELDELGEAYKHLTEEDLSFYVEIDYVLEEDVFHIINLEGEPVSITDIIDQSDFVKMKYKEAEGFEERIFFKVRDDLSHYKRVKEYYQIEGGVSNARKYYCKKPHPTIITRDLVFDYKVFVRLYDKNKKIISESKMKNQLFEGYDTVSKEDLIGMLELPPKDEREGLKYRVVRLKPNGEPSLYFDGEVKNPTQNYIWEEPLPPYSEYKNWDYFEEIGCYVYGRPSYR